MLSMKQPPAPGLLSLAQRVETRVTASLALSKGNNIHVPAYLTGIFFVIYVQKTNSENGYLQAAMCRTVSLFGNSKIPGVSTCCLAIRPGQEIVWLTVLFLLKLTRKCITLILPRLK